MDYIEFVDVLYPADDLLENGAGLVLRDPKSNKTVLFAFDDVVKEFTGFHILHDKKKLFGCFNDLIQLDDAGVSDEFEDVDLSGDPLDIRHIHNLLFIQYFDRNFFASGYVDR